MSIILRRYYVVSLMMRKSIQKNVFNAERIDVHRQTGVHK